METRPQRGFAVAGALDHEIVGPLATEAEALGYTSFWLNDTADGDGLAGLAHVAALTGTIRLGVGVIPVDRVPPGVIADRIIALGLPADRLILGIGSGSSPGGLARVRDAVRRLRGSIDPGIAIAVGALGPKMSALGGEVGDAVLLNWLAPEGATVATGWVRAGAARVGRPTPFIAAYVRVALGAPARERLREESDRYASYPSYAAHFSRLGTTAFATTIPAENPAGVVSGLHRYTGVFDSLNVRAITAEDDIEAYRRVLRAAAPGQVEDDHGGR